MEIKACPFCGNEKANADSFGNVFFVKCEGCNACGPDGKNEEEAITLWNAAPRKEDVEMKKLELYECGLCHTRYNSEEECEKCERFHRKNLNIVEAQYLSRAQDGTAMPITIILERDDGVRYTYKRWTMEG